MDYHTANPNLKQKELDNFCAETFSELIIQECISILDEDDGATHHVELFEEQFGMI